MNCVIFFVDRAVVTRHVQFVCVYALFVCALFVCALFWPQIACRPRVSCARDQLRLRTRVALQSAGPVLLGRRQRPWLRLSAFVVVRCRRCAEYSCKISGVLVCVCVVCVICVFVQSMGAQHTQPSSWVQSIVHLVIHIVQAFGEIGPV